MTQEGSQGKPWVMCPICWTPFTNEGGYGQEKPSSCINGDCSMRGHDLKLYVFDDKDTARDFAESFAESTARGVICNPPFDIMESGPWTVATYTLPLDRFRLLTGQPLKNLVPEQIIKEWMSGVIKGKSERLFRIQLFGYDRESGGIDSGTKRSLSSGRLGLPFKNSFCRLCKEIASRIKEQPLGSPNPCSVSDEEFLNQVFKHVSANKDETRRWVSDPNEPLPEEALRNFSHKCWTGLVSMAVPILVGDVLVGQAVLSQKRVLEVELSEEEKCRRDKTLAALGISQGTFQRLLAENEEVFDTLEALASERYRWVRRDVHRLQNLAFSQYGKHSYTKAQILSDRIRDRIHSKPLGDCVSTTHVWKVLGPDALGEVAGFFSFRRAYIFGGDGPDDNRLLASWTHPEESHKDIDLSGITSGVDDKMIAQQIRESVEKMVPDNWKCTKVLRPEPFHWYVFTDRCHNSGEKSESFNAVCESLLGRTVRAIHADMSEILTTFRKLDSILATVHNMRRPSSQLANAIMYFNGIIHGVHNARTTTLFAANEYLKEATDVLRDTMISVSRKIDHEVQKVAFGQDINRTLRRRRRIPIIKNPDASISASESFWEKALDSVNTFVGRTELSSLRVDAKINNSFASDEHIAIHPRVLEVLLDNLSDNAVKYSFEDTTIEIRLSRATRKIKNVMTECAVYEISNFGNGIDGSERGRIGQIYYRGKFNSTLNTKNDGTGLGVYTMGRIMEQVGGDWNWSSGFGGDTNFVEGEGWKTTFYVYFPFLGRRSRAKKGEAQ